jgi:hypothetical protein
VLSLHPVVEEIHRQIKDGRGFVLLRRLPIEDYSKDALPRLCPPPARRGAAGRTPYRIPVYSNIEGKVSVRYVRSYIANSA